MSSYEEILSEITSNKPTKLKRVIQTLADDLSRSILIHLEEGDISYRDLPMKKIGRSKISTLMALDELEALELVKSKMKKYGTRLYHTYSITDRGIDIVTNLIQNK